MDKVYDFTNSSIKPRSLGGSDRKMRVLHENGKYYMLKFSEEHLKKSDISTSHENNAFSEYISSHIAKSIGIDTHNTVIGMYNKEICVGCEDFRKNTFENIEFIEFLRMLYSAKETKRIPLLKWIYEVYDSNIFPQQLKNAAIMRYWDTFIVDALVGNFDRHAGNWGFLRNIEDEDNMILSPTYDYGSTLFPIISDEGIYEIKDSKKEILKRCLVYPSPAVYIHSQKVGKPGYYDMLASGYDKNCEEALMRVFPRIDLNKIYSIIDETPLITEAHRIFYKEILEQRYNIILKRAYLRCEAHRYDSDAFRRINEGKSIAEHNLEYECMKNAEIDELYEETHTKYDSKYNIIQYEFDTKK